MTKETKETGRKWDGKSRISNDNYRKRWNEIFNKPKKELKNGTTKKTNGTTN
jgi:hypothetical protein